jgi:hypothetical protein
MKSIIPIGLLLLVWGCAAPAPEATSMPPPTNFVIDGTAELNLTPPISIQAGLPAKLKATLHADAHSEAIVASPVQSHHEGHLSLLITDADGKQTLVNIQLTVKGDSAGTPTEGLGEVISRFMDAASMMSRPIPQPAPATGR